MPNDVDVTMTADTSNREDVVSAAETSSPPAKPPSREQIIRWLTEGFEEYPTRILNRQIAAQVAGQIITKNWPF